MSAVEHIRVFKNTKKQSKKDKIVLAHSTTDTNNQPHSVNDEPSHSTYFIEQDDTQGVVSVAMWHHHGVKHRATGPAYVSYNRDGSTGMKMYFYKGECIQSLIDSGQILINDDDSIPEDSIFTLEMMK